jgi:hypothetical protein
MSGTFKLSNVQALQKSIKSLDNAVLKAAAIQVVDGELGGWASHSSWSKFGKSTTTILC